MIFEQGVYRIEHDPDRTRSFYAQAPDTLCDCAGCRNFRAAVSRMAHPLRQFLERFGIDPSKPAEMSAVCAPAPQELCYDGFYHLSGELQAGLEPFIQTGPKSFRLDERYHVPVGDPPDVFSSGTAQLWFRADCALVDRNFPRPVVQMNVMFNLPWVLEEENPYLYTP